MESVVRAAARQFFEADDRVTAVGIGAHGRRFGLSVLRMAGGRNALPDRFRAVPVTVTRAPGVPRLQATPPEQLPSNPLHCGLEIQNWDHDLRSGRLHAGLATMGTLGGFVRDADGVVYVLSNNHVLAGENHARPGDAVRQPCAGLPPGTPLPRMRLARWVPLHFSAVGARHPAAWNEVDAAIARVGDGVAWQAGFLPVRRRAPPAGVARATLRDAVFKIGRTTGETTGVVEALTDRVYMEHENGVAWFRGLLRIRADSDRFSDDGDSGALVLRADGVAVGLLVGGDADVSWATPIDTVLDALGVELCAVP
ncbi:MAG: hypothetical protein H6704_05585 [Myxococcales bacterium]|nr:hypothetical protein [Myxococcales bacterium]